MDEHAAGLGILRPRLHPRRPRARCSRRSLIERIAGRVTYVTIIVGAVRVRRSAMLIARRREISLVRLVPDHAARSSSAGRWRACSGATDATQIVLELGLDGRAGLPRGRRSATSATPCRPRASLGDVLRVLLTISLGLEMLSGVLLDMPFALPRNPGQHRPARARSRASSARATCSGSSRSSRSSRSSSSTAPSPSAPACRSAPSCSAGGSRRSRDSPTVVVLAVGGRRRGRRARARAPHRARNGGPPLQWVLGGRASWSGSVVGYAARHPIIALARCGHATSRCA